MYPERFPYAVLDNLPMADNWNYPMLKMKGGDSIDNKRRIKDGENNMFCKIQTA
jgi:hypothetical protein